jgi:hypothetical protein
MPNTPEPSLKGEPGKRFKIKVIIPGRGEDLWVCRASGEALAYQKYCTIYGKALEFSEYQDGGKTYLQTQEGQWLSYETLSSCVYVYNWLQSSSWKIEGNRLIAEDDPGRVLSWNEKQKWPLSDGKFLQVFALSENAVTVERVEV